MTTITTMPTTTDIIIPEVIIPRATVGCGRADLYDVIP